MAVLYSSSESGIVSVTTSYDYYYYLMNLLRLGIKVITKFYALFVNLFEQISLKYNVRSIN